MTAAFYDQLAPFYHLLYADWERTISAQGDALSALLREFGVAAADPVLDAACGIGTQTIGLLQNGYEIAASDIASRALRRLKVELSSRGLRAIVRADDLRTLTATNSGEMAAVLACDNSIPHLLSDNKILQAFLSCHRCLRAGGIVVISVRDYATVARTSPDVRPYGLRSDGDRRLLAVQVWEWEGEQYDLLIYLTSESSTGVCETRVLASRYYAVTIDRLTMLLEEAGFTGVQRRQDVLFQPVLVGRRPGTATSSCPDPKMKLG